MSSSKNRKKKAKSQASNGHITVPDSSSLSCEAAGDVHKVSTFEDELAWCLNQLQIGIQSSHGAGDIKQMKTSYEKNYKSLISAKTPLPRKRQLMRSLFGDYRSKLKSHPVMCPQPGMATMKKQNTDTGWRYFKKSPALKATVGGDSIDHQSSFSFDFDITSEMLKD